MSKSIIEEICLGNRGNIDKIKMTESYDKWISEAAEVSTKLFQTLNSKQTKLYRKLETADGALTSEIALAYYIEGMKIGLRLGIECMEE